MDFLVRKRLGYCHPQSQCPRSKSSVLENGRHKKSACRGHDVFTARAWATQDSGQDCRRGSKASHLFDVEGVTADVPADREIPPRITRSPMKSAGWVGIKEQIGCPMTQTAYLNLGRTG